jgi:hypothetical protein
VIIVVVVCLASAVALVVLVLATRDDAVTTPAAPADAHTGHDMGHEGTFMAGCEGVSDTMMMLSPSSADSLLGGPCPWPYDATIDTTGGQEDPSITAPFKAHPYQDLFDLAAVAGFGVCNVGRLPDPPADGFVFGFTIDVRSGSCADGPATASIVAREQATRAWRDQNAHRADTSGADRTMVFGRWVIVLTGDEAVTAVVAERLAGAGAVGVT